MFQKILGPSPLLYSIKQIQSRVFFRGGDSNDMCLSDESFFELISEHIENDTKTDKPRRMNHQELRELISTRSKLTKEQRLIKSVLEEAKLSKSISEKGFKDAQSIFEFRRKYKNYLRIKRFIPLSLIGPFTGNELSKMAYASAIGSKSVAVTLQGLIGYSLPAFFFFHMSSFYMPDKLKPICQVCKYTLGAPFWVVGYMTDELMSHVEEKVFGEEVPLDVVGTGGTIPGDLGDWNKLREAIDDMKDFTQKTY